MHNTKERKAKLVMKFLLAILFAGLITIGCRKTENISSTDGVANAKPGAIPARDLDLQQVAGNFVSPIAMAEPPDGSHRLFVIDQPGQIWIIDVNGQTLAQPFIDITNKMVTLRTGYDERGLLGLAFHPSYKTNGKFYLFYTAPPPPGGPTTDAGNTGLPKVWDNMTTISEFTVSQNPDVANINSERIILQEPHPQFNHNGGTIAFGSDGYLYISIGDGGNKNDLGPGHEEDWYGVNAGGNAQNIEKNFMGKVLRIDVNSSSGGKNYSIPSDNPFVEKSGLDEIWAYGFRNPYRFSFDMSRSQRLLVGDAGQSLYEEISDVKKGGNYGWNVKEGTVCFNAANEFTVLSDCPTTDAFGNALVDPVIQAPNAANPEGGNFVVIVAGYVYRGNSIPGLQGKYLFGNFSSDFSPTGEVYVSNPSGSGLWSYEKLSFKSFGSINIGYYVKGFGQDSNGEVYVLGTKRLGPAGNTGVVLKIVGEKKNTN